MNIKFFEYNIPKLTRIDGSVRLYETPEGNRYPSVTSIVGLHTSQHIDEWVQKVGEKTAAEISGRAASRGTLIHENCENYLQGKPLTFSMFQVEERKMFNHFLPILDSITEVHAMETQLYSDKLQCAGTVDLICRLGGDIMVLDWKTSGRYKSASEIDHYFMQCACYAYMFYERTGVAIGKIKIAMTTEEFGLLQFEEEVKTWLPKFIQLRNEYRKLKNL
jgi:genome maintenance exonuclease 1